MLVRAVAFNNAESLNRGTRFRQADSQASWLLLRWTPPRQSSGPRSLCPLSGCDNFRPDVSSYGRHVGSAYSSSGSRRGRVPAWCGSVAAELLIANGNSLGVAAYSRDKVCRSAWKPSPSLPCPTCSIRSVIRQTGSKLCPIRPARQFAWPTKSDS